MKISLFLTALFCIQLIFTGCPGPSGFSGVRWPNAIADGAGGVVIVYQVNEGNTRAVYVQKLGTGGETLWSGKGVPLYSEPGLSEGGGITASLINSDDSNIFIVWGDINGTHAQKVDASGRFLWDENTPASSGIYSINAIGDSSGGMIVARSGDILGFQRLGSNGDILWEIASTISNVQFLNFTIDASGNTFIVWEDEVSNIFAQKLDNAGRPAWTSGGVLLSRKGTGDGMQTIINDGNGGAIITWISGIQGENKGSFIGNELYAQRISAEGKAIWGTNGVPVVTVEQAQVIFMPVEPRLIGDGSGGAFVIWRGGMSIFAQKINASGELLLSQGGIRVWEGERSPCSPLFNVIADNSGGFIIVWNYIEEGKMLGDSHDLRAQRYDASGNKLWGEDSILVTKQSLGYITPMSVTPDGNGGAIISWAAGANIHNASLSYVQRMSADGALMWGENGIILK